MSWLNKTIQWLLDEGNLVWITLSVLVIIYFIVLIIGLTQLEGR